MPRKAKRYGWRPDLPDFRDHQYAAPPPPEPGLPPSADLTPHCPAVYNQLGLGSCTAQAIAAAYEFDQIKENLPRIWIPSRLFIYYNERVIEGDVSQDNGAQLRDGIKSVAAQGVCSEDLWPYTDDEVKFSEKPSQACYDNAKTNLVTSYRSVSQSLSQMKGCLASGYPFVFGFTVYDSFEGQKVAATGILDMPISAESVLGGHAVLCVGYDDVSQRFLVRNSWGIGWGLNGYFSMPYTYLMDPNLSSDLWTIRWVQGTAAAIS